MQINKAPIKHQRRLHRLTLVILSLFVAVSLHLATGEPVVRANVAYRLAINDPVLFIHGFSSTSSVDCASYFAKAINYLNNSHDVEGMGTVGWQGPKVTLKYYTDDSNDCNKDINNNTDAISHCEDLYNNVSAYIVDNNDTSMTYTSCLLAWEIWNDYTSRNQNVQVVAHSLGGLLIRYALYATQQNGFNPNSFPEFPGPLLVQDVVTIATPHGGVPGGNFPWSGPWGCNGCTETNEMTPGSDFMNTLYNYGQNPQGAGWGTDWTMIGDSFSQCNDLKDTPFSDIGAETYMFGGHKDRFVSPCYEHFDPGADNGNIGSPSSFLTDTSDNHNAQLYWCDNCVTDPPTEPDSNGNLTWTYGYGPHSLHTMLDALLLSTW